MQSLSKSIGGAVAPASGQRHHLAGGRRAVATAPRGELEPASAAPLVSRSALLKTLLLAAGGAALPSPLALAEAPVAVTAASASTMAPAAPLAAALPPTISSVMLRTLADCQLAVSVYPTFGYNAAGGGGAGQVRRRDDGLLEVEFDPASLDIPAIDTAHASILGLPLPPPLRIEIRPQRLSGTIDPATGEANLDFLARFNFTVGSLYSAPSLIVGTTLTTEESDGVLRHGTGRRLSADGRARLVGVARVPRTGDAFLDSFLMLPTDALAVLSAELTFS